MKKIIFTTIALLFTVVSLFAQGQTYVQSHYRTSPNNTVSDNWSTVGNVNPYTGQAGTKSYPSDSYYSNSYSNSYTPTSYYSSSSYYSSPSTTYTTSSYYPSSSFNTNNNYPKTTYTYPTSTYSSSYSSSYYR